MKRRRYTDEQIVRYLRGAEKERGRASWNTVGQMD